MKINNIFYPECECPCEIFEGVILHDKDCPNYNRCESGCQVFEGGEVRHLESCVYYPESRTKMYDDLKADYKQLKNLNDKVIKLIMNTSKFPALLFTLMSGFTIAHIYSGPSFIFPNWASCLGGFSCGWIISYEILKILLEKKK